MDRLPFSIPVSVRVSGTIQEIRSVREATAFLRWWPSERRGPVHNCALRGCNEASAGQFTSEQARQAFSSFARISGILAGEGAPANGPMIVDGKLQPGMSAIDDNASHPARFK
jgi:hypothetical protein